jgi:N-acyl-D-amino-acid deacylase
MLFLASCALKYDVIVRNGNIYDGTGLSAYQADIGIKGNKIAAIGDLKDQKGKTEINAEGMAVSPGFINMLSWANNHLLEDGRSMSDIKQGVTLEVFGEGSSMGPLNDSMKIARKGAQWTTLGEYLDLLVKKGVSTNVASFVGATTVRINILGFENRKPDIQELELMKALVQEAMEEGAMGLGTSLIYPPAFLRIQRN